MKVVSAFQATLNCGCAGPDLMEHPDYDNFWQSRNLRDHLNNVNCAVLSVGGWYDAEDPLGPFAVYQEATARNPDNDQITIVAGPWAHGQWSGGQGKTKLGDVEFFGRTEEYFREVSAATVARASFNAIADAPPLLPTAYREAVLAQASADARQRAARAGPAQGHRLRGRGK